MRPQAGPVTRTKESEMPCQVYMTEEEELAADRRALRSKLNETTRLLCLACQMLERVGVPKPNELEGWWGQHKKNPGHEHPEPPPVDKAARAAVVGARNAEKKKVQRERLLNRAKVLLNQARDLGYDV